MLKYLFFLLSFTRSYCDVLNTSNVNRLKEHLLSDYRADTIPTQSEPLNLSIGIAVRAFNNIDQKEGIVSLNLWLRYRWNDYNFKWNENNWNNIQSLTLRTDPQLDGSVWTPDIYLYNTAENPLENLKWSNVEVNSNGDILWSRPGIIQSTCSFDMTHFPYDIQVCELKFGSWSYTGSHLKLIDATPAIDLSNYQENEEWELSNVSYEINSIKYACCPDEYYDTTFTINLKRLTGYYETNIIIPTFATASLILITLLIPWDSGERISFAVTVMLSIIVFLLILSDTLPKSNQQPLLSRMIMALTFFSLFGVFFTVLISALNSYKNEKIDGKNKIESRIVQFLFKMCNIFCVFRRNSCHTDIETEGISSLGGYPSEIENTEEETEDTSFDESGYRTNSYYTATKTIARNRKQSKESVNSNMELTNIEQNNLKEDCDKMISALETVYSLAFLITFIALCVVMFSSRQ